MHLLTTTTQVLRASTSTAATIDVTASFIDQANALFTLGSQLTVINSATTTTLVSAPAASTTRIIKLLTIRNRDASLSSTISVSRYNGITSTSVYQVTLPAGGAAIYDSKTGWTTVAPPGSVTQQTLTLPGSGVYVTPSGVRTIQVECVGGGGSGGGSSAPNNYVAGGGGGGAYARSFIQHPASSYSYTVGSGGARTSATFIVGNNGAATNFGGVVIAAGGTGGAAGTGSGVPITGSLGGAGGLASASTGDLKVSGGSGGSSYIVTNFQNVGGFGGISAFSKFQPPTAAYQNIAGIIAITAASSSFGVGGGGAHTNATNSGDFGGAGGDGVIRITEYR